MSRYRLTEDAERDLGEIVGFVALDSVDPSEPLESPIPARLPPGAHLGEQHRTGLEIEPGKGGMRP